MFFILVCAILLIGSVTVLFLPDTVAGRRAKRLIYVVMIGTVALLITIVVGLIFFARAPL